MKKLLFTFFSLLFLFVNTNGMAQISALSELSNSKAYNLTCTRGSLGVSDNNLAATCLSAYTASNFAILSYNDNYYLYSVAASAFINASGEATNTSPVPVNITANGNNQFIFNFNSSAYINVNTDFTYGLTIDDWSTADGGNLFTITEAEDFDATAALSVLSTPVTLTTISSLSDLSNSKVYAVTNARATWYVASGATAMTTSTTLDPSQGTEQFGILKYEDSYYLYSVTAQGFLTSSNTFSSTPTKVNITETGDADYPFFFSFDESHNINVGGSNQITIDSWTTLDAGNKNALYIADDYDFTSVLAAIQEFIENYTLTTGEVTVTQGYQTTGVGNENTLLLRVDLEPSNDITNVTMDVTLTTDAVANISSLYLYEVTDQQFINSIPTSPLATASEVTSNVTFSLGDLSAGTYYYCLCATVSSSATLGAILDASVTSIGYEFDGVSKTLDMGSAGNPDKQGAKVFSQQNFVFIPTEDNCKFYRIPAMTLDQNGNIVVAIDKRYNSQADLGWHKIDVVSKRSEDGGVTWQDLATVAVGDGSTAAYYGYGDPALLRAADGSLICVMAAGSRRWGSSTTDGMRFAGVARSTDNGVSWTLTPDIFSTQNFYDEVHEATGSMGFSNIFTTSGKGLCTTDGVLMFATNCTEMDTTSPALCYILYSTDNGVTWRLSNALGYSGCDESKLEQLNDGSLLLSVRQSGNRGWNTATYTKNSDGTVTFNWGTQYRTADIWGNACNADLVYYSRKTEGDPDIMLHSFINTSGRESLQLSMSIDGGSSWYSVYNIQPNGSCYSTMEVLPDGTVALLYEDASYNPGNGFAINYVTITKEQIMAWYNGIFQSMVTPEVKVAYGSSGEASFGSWSNLTWTSAASSGLAGVTMTWSSGTHDKFSNWNSRYNLAYRAATAGSDETFTLTAPEGYIIKGYSMELRNYSAGSATLTAADGTSVTTTTTEYQTLAVSNLNTQSTVITVNAANTSNWMTISNFTLQLQKEPGSGDIDKSGEVDMNDVTVLVSVLFGTAETGTYDADAADVDGNGIISLADLPALIDKLLK